jgi:putative ABC transport system permease protein
MNLRDFRIGWRLLAKEPAYSSVVILGLAVGFAACFLLLGYVRHSFSYDRDVPERERIFRLMQHWNTPGSSGRWGEEASLPARDAALKSGVPLLASTFIERKIDVRAGAQVQTISITVVDPDFQKIFGIQPLAGDLQAALTRPDALALTQETATRLFGSLDVVGKSVLVGGRPYLVAALLRDQPSATTLPFTALAGTATTLWNAQYRQLVTTNWGSSHGPVYIKLQPGANVQALLDAVGHALLNSRFYQRMGLDQVAALGGRHAIDFRLGPLAEAYLDPTLDVRNAKHGDRQAILGLAAVGLLILLLAATNYVNLATVRTLRRQREIAVRKVLGASAPAVSRQFLAESVLVCLIATGFGLVLAWLLLPVFSSLVQRKLDDMFSAGSIAGGIVLGVLLGLAAGAYPTWAALRVRPTSALAGRGNSETAGGLWLRRVLTVLQFATAMGLTGLTLAVAWQTHYASQLDPGFDPSRLLSVAASDDLRNANVRAFRDALQRLPGVEGVAVSDAPVTVNRNSTSLKREGGSPLEISFLVVSPNFFDVYGLKPLAGRLYDPRQDKVDGEAQQDKVVLNEAAAKKLGFASAHDAAGKYILDGSGHGTPMQVVGVAPDIRHRSARESMQPTVYFLSNETSVFTIKAREPESARREIEAMWTRFFPNDVLDVKRVGGLFALNYADDLRLAKLLAASSVIAIAIAAFGIYVLAAYSVQRRTREIVLRKLYGASGGAIGRLVAREFAALLGIGALAGLPVAWLATERYLAGFTERAPMGLWALGAALAVAATVALASTLRHTLGAVRVAPVLALRD